MNDLPVRTAFRDDKGDATIPAEGLTVSHAGHGIQTGD